MAWSEQARRAAAEARRRKSMQKIHGVSRDAYARQLKYARQDIGRGKQHHAAVKTRAVGAAQAYERVRAEEGSSRSPRVGSRHTVEKEAAGRIRRIRERRKATFGGQLAKKRRY